MFSFLWVQISLSLVITLLGFLVTSHIYLCSIQFASWGGGIWTLDVSIGNNKLLFTGAIHTTLNTIYFSFFLLPYNSISNPSSFLSNPRTLWSAYSLPHCLCIMEHDFQIVWGHVGYARGCWRSPQ